MRARGGAGPRARPGEHAERDREHPWDLPDRGEGRAGGAALLEEVRGQAASVSRFPFSILCAALGHTCPGRKS